MKEYDLKKEDIKNMLFIILFWIPKEEINFIFDDEDEKIYKINLNDILDKGKKILDSTKNFINDLVEKNTLVDINNFFYENIKCFSLLFCFNEDINDNDDDIKL